MEAVAADLSRQVQRYWHQNDHLRLRIDEFGEGVLSSNSWSVSVRYDGSRVFTVEVDEEAACKAIEERLGTDTGAVKLAALRTELESRAAETSPDAEGAQVATAEAQNAQRARAEIDRLYPESIDVDLAVYRKLATMLPRFFYFDEYAANSASVNSNVAEMGKAEANSPERWCSFWSHLGYCCSSNFRSLDSGLKVCSAWRMFVLPDSFLPTRQVTLPRTSMTPESSTLRNRSTRNEVSCTDRPYSAAQARPRRSRSLVWASGTPRCWRNWMPARFAVSLESVPCARRGCCG